MFAKGLHMTATTLLLALALLGQSPQAPKTPAEPIKLTGCVSAKPGAGGDYTLTTAEEGSQYRLTGKDIRKFAGKKVEVTENTSKGFRIRGGLYPSPNVAGQAGALDPAQAAIATQPGVKVPSDATVDLPEFRASRVRAVAGACQ
jgi:hypothetical protein